MATLEKIRNQGTLLLIVVGLALLAFILGDFFMSGDSFLGRNQYEIAQIKGKSIPFQEYQERVDHITELNKTSSRQTSLDEQTIENIREEVWKQLVQQYLLDRSYSNLGIAISVEELSDMVQGRNIHPIIRQNFGNPQTGQVDPAAVNQFLRTMDQDPSGFQKAVWLYFEDLIIRDRQFTKYNNLISKGLFTTNFQASQSVNERAKRVDFDYIVGRYTTIDDSLVAVSNREIQDYYKKNKNNYEQQASRDVEYVVFPIVPSQEDFLVAEEWVNRIKDDFINASDPIQFTNLNSDTPFGNRFYKSGDFENEELNQWAFTAKVGDHFGPIFDGVSYQIARLVNVAHMPDSVKARHILIGTSSQSQAQYDAAKATADSLLNVIKRGGNFARLATQYSEDPGSASQGGDLGWFPEGVMVQPFNDACFNGKKGDVVLVETQFGHHIIEIQDLSRPSKKVQVAILERTVVPSTRTYQKIYQEASEFAGLNNTFEKFDVAVKEKRLSKRIASNLRELDKQVAGLENPREMIRWAYRSKENTVSPVFEFGDNFVVAALTRVREEGHAPIESVSDQIKSQLIRDKKALILEERMSNAMAKSNSIQDLSTTMGISIQSASRISFSSFSLPAAGFEPAVISKAVFANEGELAGPIKGNTGVFALQVTALNFDEVDEMGEKRRLTNLYQTRALREPYEAIKERANIVDKRSRFF